MWNVDRPGFSRRWNRYAGASIWFLCFCLGLMI